MPQPIRARRRIEFAISERSLLVHGERRWRAAMAAGLNTIDCCFEDDDMDHPERLERQLVENIQRASLEPLDEASVFQELMGLRGWNGKQLAEALPGSQSRRVFR